MATFQELFPDTPQEPFDPIKLGPTNPRLEGVRQKARSAIPVPGNTPDSSFEADLDELMSGYKTPTKQGQAEWSDYGRALMSGIAGTGATVASAGRAISDRFRGDESSGGEQFAASVSDAFGSASQAMRDYGQSWIDRMTPEAQTRLAKQWASLDPTNSIWRGGVRETLSSIAMQATQSLPSTLTPLAGGGLLMRAGARMLGRITLGASEAVMSIGDTSDQIRQEVMDTPDDQLQQDAPRYAQLRASMEEPEARAAYAREVEGMLPQLVGATVGLISSATGRYLEPIFLPDQGMKAGRRMARGAIFEGLMQEAPQNAAQQIAQNYAAQTFDKSRSLTQGVGEQVLQGAGLGGALGAGAALVGGRGPRPEPPPPLPEESPVPAPESFDQVFGDQTPPQGGWRGGDIENAGLADVDSAGQRLMSFGNVDPALQAAANARRDGMITDMLESQGMDPRQEQQAYVQKPWLMRQDEMSLPQASTDMVPAEPSGEQMTLPLTRREQGVGRQPVGAPMAAQPMVEDMSAPPQFSLEREAPRDPLPSRRPTRADFLRARAQQDTAAGYAGTVVDPRQRDMFAAPGELPDAASAEPVGDLNAQLQELTDPDSPRMGVYLSAANMAQLDQLPTVGVPMANFDGKGGVLIAKNRKAADELLAMREQGAASMQEILGLATGAGGGKPLDGDIAVQQRDEKGNVVRESLVSTPEEADALAEQFDEPGREGVVLSAGMAIKRRAQRIAAEQRQAKLQQVTKTASRRVGDIAEQLGAEEMAPGMKDNAATYQRLKVRLAEAEKAQSDAPTRAGRLRARAVAEQIQQRMSDLRADVEQEVKASGLNKPARFEDARASLEGLTDEQINALPDADVEELFREAANVASGSRVKRKSDLDKPAGEGRNELFIPEASSRLAQEAGATNVVVAHGRTVEEIIAAHPTRSEKLKFVGRLRRTLRMRKHGGKAKTAPITATATARKTAEGTSVPVRKTELRPAKALDTEPPRELSKAEAKKHATRVRQTFHTLDTQLQTFAQKEEAIAAQLAQEAKTREGDGNPSALARNATYGMAYLRTLVSYGRMLSALRPRSNAALKEVERFSSTLEKFLKTPLDKLALQLSNAMQAESDVQARSAVRADPTVMKSMNTKAQRLQLAEKYNEKVEDQIKAAKRLHDVWHKNAKFEQHVAPLMQKLVGYVTRDNSLANIGVERRGLGYIPTFSEMRALRYALMDFKKTNREELYKPLKRWFSEYGYKFDDDGDLILAKNAGQFDYSVPDSQLEQGRDAFRNTPLNANQKRRAHKQRQLDAVYARERARRAGLTQKQRDAEDRKLVAALEEDRRSRMSYEQRKALESMDRRGLNLTLLDVNQDAGASRRAAEAIAEVMEDQSAVASGNAVLQRISAALPENHPYQPLVKRLLALRMDDVIVGWDRTGKIIGRAFGNYRQETDPTGEINRVIRFNRPKFEAMRARGEDPAPFFVHAMLHEFVHAATTGAINNDPRVRAAFVAIMRQARTSARKQGVSLNTGLDSKGNVLEAYGFSDNSPDEFVAEAFTNPNFQSLLMGIEVEPQRTIWDYFIGVVRRLLGLAETPQVNNVLELVMATADRVFTGELIETRGKASLDIKDDSAREIAGNVLDKAFQAARINKSVRDRATNLLEHNKEAGSRFLLSALTMEQLRDFYTKSFSGKNNSAPLASYMKAFFERNADNSANLSGADKLSRDWTKYAERDPEGAVAMSRIMSDATLYGIHPDERVQSNANAHIQTAAQRARHAELSTQFKALSADWQQLYRGLREYYTNTLRTETNLVTLNALRGVATKNGIDFKYKEEDVERLKLNTLQGMEKEFGEDLSANARKTIAKISQIAMQREGPYFPLSRFGDYVVTAERVKERKYFTDKKDATVWAAEQRAEDPTLDVSSPKESDGGYTVTVLEKEVRFAESPSEAAQDREEMVAIYGDGNVTTPMLKSELYTKGTAISSGTALHTILSNLEGNPAAQSAIKDFYLRALADRSFRKHEIKRQNRRGVRSEQQHRSFATYAKAAAYFTSQLRYGHRMASALSDMDAFIKDVASGREQSDLSAIRLGEVVREINTRDKLTHDPQEMSKIIRGSTELSQFMMLTSPSYWMINLTQPYMVTLPWLAARTSVGEATAALTTAQKLIASPLVNQMGESWGGLKALTSKVAAERAFTVLEQVEEHIRQRGGARAQEYINMLDNLKKRSIIDLSFVAELRDIAEGQATGWTQKVKDASRIMSHLTEVNNRIMTAIAAYDLYRTKGYSIQQAEGFAQQAVSLTQFNYSSGNAPRLFQSRGPLGPMGPLVFQFMKYPQHIYALLIDNFRRAVKSGDLEAKVARKTLMGLFATHIAAGGLVGAMLQPAKWAIGLAAMALGDDDEPYTLANAFNDTTANKLIREATNDLFGSDLGELLAAGLPHAVGVDVSSRMSLGTLYMIDLNGRTAESLLGSTAMTFGGPAVNMAANWYSGMQYMAQGQEAKGLEAFMPKGMKDVLRMIRYSSEGLTDASGKEIISAEHMTPGQLFAQSMGFQPSEVSEKYNQRSAINAKRTYDQERRQALMTRYLNASAAERADVIREITEFNRTNQPAAISRSQLLRAAQSFREREQRTQRYGADLRKRELAYAEAGSMYEDDEE